MVVADTCLVMLQDILDTDISVADYLSHRYPEELLNKVTDGDLRSALQLIAGRQYTSLADINIATRLVEVSREFGSGRAPIRYARHLNIRDFKTENFVIIGSRRGVPWVQLFEPQLNFSFEEDKAIHRFYFRNKKPKPGEPSTYVPTANGGNVETYADIALLPNLGNTGSVLILSGITMEAAESAGTGCREGLLPGTDPDARAASRPRALFRNLVENPSCRGSGQKFADCDLSPDSARRDR